MFGIKAEKPPEKKTCEGCGAKLGFMERKLRGHKTCPKCRALSKRGYTPDQVRQLRKIEQMPPMEGLTYMKQKGIRF